MANILGLEHLRETLPSQPLSRLGSPTKGERRARFEKDSFLQNKKLKNGKVVAQLNENEAIDVLTKYFEAMTSLSENYLISKDKNFQKEIKNKVEKGLELDKEKIQSIHPIHQRYISEIINQLVENKL